MLYLRQYEKHPITLPIPKMHKFAKTANLCVLSHKKGRYASEEENGEDMGQILVLIRFEASWKKPLKQA